MPKPLFPLSETTPLVTPLTNWTAITQTTEYQIDLANLTNVLSRSIGNDTISESAQVFIYVICHLAAIQRYFIRHFGETHDLDTTPFLQEMADETGFGLPLTQDIPLVELLRESKSWYGHKSTAPLFNFVADLVGSPIELEYPKDLIFTLDDSRSCISGKVTTNGGLQPWDESDLAHIRDGIYWADFVYVVNVLQAQQINSITDLFNLLDNIHPAGMKRFVTLNYNFVLPPETTQSLYVWNDLIFDRYFISESGPTLDNGWILDAGAELDMQNGNILLMTTNVREIFSWQIDSKYQTFSSDRLTHDYVEGNPNRGFSRYIFQPNNTYTQVWADNDFLTLQNVSMNVGLAVIEYQDLAGLTYRELRFAAYNLDHAMDYAPFPGHENWMQEQLGIVITVT